jgi:hypothetical protein
MLVLVLAAESFVKRHEVNLLDSDEWQYHLARRDSARNARGRDVLCFGDSLMKVSVIPRVVEARSGLKVYNLAMCGSQAPASYEVLRRALRSGARPSAVLVDFHAPLLAFPAAISVYRLPHLLDGGEALRLGWVARDLTLLGMMQVRQCLPSVRTRVALRAWVVSAVAGKFFVVCETMPQILRHWIAQEGALVMPSAHGRAVDVANHQRYQYPPGWAPDRVNADYVRRFLALAAANDLIVYWLIPPVQPALQAAKERAGHDAKYLKWVKDCQRRFPNVVVLDGRHAEYDPAVYCDADHLAVEGAYALSEDLGDVLRRLRRETPPDRWVALPRYRARAVDPSIETVYKSKTEGPADGTVRR